MHSLVAVSQRRMPAGSAEEGDWLVRLHAGIEDQDDLLADLRAAL